MSDSDDIHAWDDEFGDGDDDKSGLIAGGFDGSDKRSRRQSSRNDKGPQYKDASSSDDDDDDDKEEKDESEDEDDEVVVVESDDSEKKKSAKKKSVASTKANAPPPKKKTPPPKSKSPKKSPRKLAAAAAKEEVALLLSADDDDDDEKKPSAAAATNSKSTTSNDNDDAPKNNQGIDVIIPHSLLTKHQGSGKNECTMLVQVESNDDASHHLDFHGQSGAIGRFEADEEGVILDLKGYQYRGTIRPGPTAMVVALTRDGQFKVEAIIDEFVTLDTNTKTDVMAKLDAVVKGDMDETYMYREDNVNVNKKNKGKAGDDNDKKGGEGGEKGKKRASVAKGSGSAPKKRKTSVAKK